MCDDIKHRYCLLSKYKIMRLITFFIIFNKEDVYSITYII